MAHSSQNQNPIHQSATAGFQPESMGLQSPFDSQSFNSMPANGMASRSAGAPATLNISAQADSTQIDVGFAGDNQNGQKPFSMKLNGLGLSDPTEWAQGLRQVGNAMSSWLQRVSGEIVGADASIERPGAGLPKPSEMGNAGAPKTLVGIIDTGFGANDHGRKILDTIQTGDNDTSVWLGGGVGAGTWADSLNEFVDVAKASGNPRAVANLSFDLSQVNPDGSVSTRYQLTAKEQTALANAAANDVLVVAASGNQGGVMSALGLASQQHDNVIAVGAAEGNDRAAYSSYGPGLGFLAEGTGQGGKGTSIAAANLTETITDVWAANPNLSSGQVVQTLKDTAIDLHQLGPDIKTGHGVVDRDRAVEQASAGEKADQPVFDFQQEQLGSHLSLDSFNSQNRVFPDSTIASERPALSLSKEEIAKAMDGAANKLNALDRIDVPPEDEGYPDIEDEARKIKALRDPLYFDQVFRYEQGVSPKKSSLVEKWQKKINDSGILGYPIATDGKFGRESSKAALQFQKKNGLPADGILGPETWKTTFNNLQETSVLGNSSRETLRYGDGIQTSDDGLKDRVGEWQKFLNGQGLSRKLEEDGQFGSNTKEMTVEFQRNSKIGDDGIVGKQTWGVAERKGFKSNYGSNPTGIQTVSSPDSKYPRYSGEMTSTESLSSNMRAFLDTISYAEGTYRPDGYRTIFGGETVNSLERHPNIHKPFRNTTSTAAGRYQFLNKTWNGVQKKLGLQDFSPESQDIAAVEKIKERGAFKDIESGRFEQAIKKLGKEWASLPGSPYGQPVKPMSTLKNFYETRLEQYGDKILAEEVVSPQPQAFGEKALAEGRVRLDDDSKRIFGNTETGYEKPHASLRSMTRIMAI